MGEGKQFVPNCHKEQATHLSLATILTGGLEECPKIGIKLDCDSLRQQCISLIQILMMMMCKPVMMLARTISTWLSRSGRVCSCQKPTTWPSSCTTMPNLSQFLPMEIACGPLPRLPTKEQHLKPTTTLREQWLNLTYRTQNNQISSSLSITIPSRVCIFLIPKC